MQVRLRLLDAHPLRLVMKREGEQPGSPIDTIAIIHQFSFQTCVLVSDMN